MSVVHLLRGYDRASDALRAEYIIPDAAVPAAVSLIQLEPDDPDAHGVYPLDASAVLGIARLLGCEHQVSGELTACEFFLEAEADHATVRDQVRQLARGLPRAS
jgi:non-ribosomal peptide synthetase component F